MPSTTLPTWWPIACSTTASGKVATSSANVLKVALKLGPAEAMDSRVIRQRMHRADGDLDLSLSKA
jgi:hypothetical protein